MGIKPNQVTFFISKCSISVVYVAVYCSTMRALIFILTSFCLLSIRKVKTQIFVVIFFSSVKIVLLNFSFAAKEPEFVSGWNTWTGQDKEILMLFLEMLEVSVLAPTQNFKQVFKTLQKYFSPLFFPSVF